MITKINIFCISKMKIKTLLVGSARISWFILDNEGSRVGYESLAIVA